MFLCKKSYDLGCTKRIGRVFFMFKKQSFGLVFGVLLSFFIGLVLTFYIQLMYAGGLTLEGFLTGFIKNFTVGFTCASIIPLGSIGSAFLRLVKCPPQKRFLANILSNIPTMVIMAIVLNFLLFFLVTGISPDFLPLFWSSLPGVILVAYLAGVVFTPISEALAIRLASREDTPAAA